MSKEEFTVCLAELGLTDAEVRKYAAGDKNKKLDILNELRRRKVNLMNAVYKDLECIDYIIANVEKGAFDEDN